MSSGPRRRRRAGRAAAVSSRSMTDDWHEEKGQPEAHQDLCHQLGVGGLLAGGPGSGGVLVALDQGGPGERQHRGGGQQGDRRGPVAGEEVTQNRVPPDPPPRQEPVDHLVFDGVEPGHRLCRGREESSDFAPQGGVHELLPAGEAPVDGGPSQTGPLRHVFHAPAAQAVGRHQFRGRVEQRVGGAVRAGGRTVESAENGVGP